VVTGAKQPSVIKIVEDRCKETGSELLRLGKDFNYKIKKESLERSVFDLTFDRDRIRMLNDLKLSLLGRYQVENASLAIAAVMQLEKYGFRVGEGNIRKALKTAFFPGRFELIKRRITQNPTQKDAAVSVDQRIVLRSSANIILDGAHNPTKMKAFLTTLKKLFPKEKKVFVIGFKFDKDIPKMLQQILKVADTLIITQFHGKTDLSANASTDTKTILEDIKTLRYYDIKKIIVDPDSRKAINKALSILISQYPNIPAIIVVTGSLYLVGEITNML
jgi:dihydrofolate synthase/folylpolyglutamate synthase